MPETDAQLMPPPGWGTPLPPEKPRTDLPSGASPDEPAAPTGHGHESQRKLDPRRLAAHVIDELLLVKASVAIFFLYENLTIAAFVMFLAVRLSYYFVCETAWGQTLGKRVMRLRVVRVDGGGAPASKIAGRTIFRLIEFPVLPLPIVVLLTLEADDMRVLLLALPAAAALFTMLLTGHRRQRVGDLAAGTIVRRADGPFAAAPESPLLVIYPIVWVAGALAAIAVFPDKPLLELYRSNHPYMAKIDRICEKRVRQERALLKTGSADIIAFRTFYRQEQRKIEKLPPPPPEVRKDVREVLRIHSQLNRALDRAIRNVQDAPDPAAAATTEMQGIMVLAENAEQRFAELGLPYCTQ